MFYISEPLVRGYKTHNEFYKYRMKWNFISESFNHMIILKISVFHQKSVKFDIIPRENRHETSCYAPTSDVSCK